MERESISLDGLWDFHFCGDQEIALASVASWQSCPVPSSWQTLPGFEGRGGHAWYRRMLDIPTGWQGSRLFIRFGAAHHFARVEINGVALGENEGGDLPFEIDVTDAVEFGGTNELAVHVVAPGANADIGDFEPAEIPGGTQKMHWLAGIWQSVEIERRAEIHFNGPRVCANFHEGTVHVQADLSGALPQGYFLEAEIEGPDRALVACDVRLLPADHEAVDLVLTVPAPHGWSPDEPALYRLNLVLRRGDTLIDMVNMPFGFRTVEADGERIFLNGRPLFLCVGAEQDFGIGSSATPAEAFLEYSFRRAKARGFNALHCGEQLLDPRCYEIADRLGVAIFRDLPSVARLTTESAWRTEQTLRGAVDRDDNHPSILGWTLFRQEADIDLVRNEQHRTWLKHLFDWLRAYDPMRIVVCALPAETAGLESALAALDVTLASLAALGGKPRRRAA